MILAVKLGSYLPTWLTEGKSGGQKGAIRMKGFRLAASVMTLCAMLLFSSGCAALLLLGLGGAGGYFIKKGEGSDNKKRSSFEHVDPKHASSTEGEAGKVLGYKVAGISG